MSTPNLLFLMTDQQRGDTVAPDGPCQMPNVQGLAEGGTRFERCYAPNPICSPTRASLMTGKLPHNHGMVDCTHTVEPYRAKLKEGLPFWSRTLHEAGYRTGYFGKWHVERSGELERFGWEQYEVDGAGYRAHRAARGLATKPALSHECRVAQKGYEDFLLYGVTDEPADSSYEHYLYSRGIDFLEEAAQDGSRPWALFVSTEGPHDPYVVPREQWERYDPASLPKPASFDDSLLDRPGIYRRVQRVWEGLEWEHFAEATACYYALCSLIDDQVGRILAKLEALGQLDNTLIIFTSDHGDYMGAHRLFLKGIPAFEEAYHVPLVLNGPGVPQGRTVPDVTSLMDLAASIVPLTTGGDFPAEGRSLLPLLQPEPTQRRGGRKPLRRGTGSASFSRSASCGGSDTSTCSTALTRTNCTTWRRIHTSLSTWPTTPRTAPCWSRWPRACGRSSTRREISTCTSRSMGCSASPPSGRPPSGKAARR